MKDNFKDLLKQFRADNNLSQNDFVDLFLSSGNSLSKLDTVTLSRWENGKTVPSIAKKITIMRTLNLLVSYIYSIHGFDIPTKINSSLNTRFGIEYERYRKLNKPIITNHIKFEHTDQRDKIQPHIKEYLISETMDMINIIPPSSLSIGRWFSDDKTEAFFIHAFANSSIYGENGKDGVNSIIMFEQVTSSRFYYKLCTLCLFNAILNNQHLDYFFIHVNTKYFFKLALSFGCDVVTTINELSAPSNEDMNLKHTNILKIEIDKLLSNKDFLFFCLQSRIDIKAVSPQSLEEIDRIYKSI
ncbi:helix-turn-helix transcriptional regulator [uncultured Photobacterium sp.]|uniref:helix-turn-helix transcriptional regulator n=1 Tax=uncultured Photobacterium sp. TaxID=173973 RepID=UPI0026174093|nr:helix-turn-helix transcriptional regulator [uncultured Photobacterium sp.]